MGVSEEPAHLTSVQGVVLGQGDGGLHSRPVSSSSDTSVLYRNRVLSQDTRNISVQGQDSRNISVLRQDTKKITVQRQGSRNITVHRQDTRNTSVQGQEAKDTPLRQDIRNTKSVTQDILRTQVLEQDMRNTAVLMRATKTPTASRQESSTAGLRQDTSNISVKRSADIQDRRAAAGKGSRHGRHGSSAVTCPRQADRRGCFTLAPTRLRVTQTNDHEEGHDTDASDTEGSLPPGCSPGQSQGSSSSFSDTGGEGAGCLCPCQGPEGLRSVRAQQHLWQGVLKVQADDSPTRDRPDSDYDQFHGDIGKINASQTGFSVVQLACSHCEEHGQYSDTPEGVFNTTCNPGGVFNTSCNPEGVSNTNCNLEGVFDPSCSFGRVVNPRYDLEGVFNTSCNPGGVSNTGCNPEKVFNTGCNLEGVSNISCNLEGVFDPGCTCVAHNEKRVHLSDRPAGCNLEGVSSTSCASLACSEERLTSDLCETASSCGDSFESAVSNVACNTHSNPEKYSTTTTVSDSHSRCDKCSRLHGFSSTTDVNECHTDHNKDERPQGSSSVPSVNENTTSWNKNSKSAAEVVNENATILDKDSKSPAPPAAEATTGSTSSRDNDNRPHRSSVSSPLCSHSHYDSSTTSPCSNSRACYSKHITSRSCHSLPHTGHADGRDRSQHTTWQQRYSYKARQRTPQSEDSLESAGKEAGTRRESDVLSSKPKSRCSCSKVHSSQDLLLRDSHNQERKAPSSEPPSRCLSSKLHLCQHPHAHSGDNLEGHGQSQGDSQCQTANSAGRATTEGKDVSDPDRGKTTDPHPHPHRPSSASTCPPSQTQPVAIRSFHRGRSGQGGYTPQRTFTTELYALNHGGDQRLRSARELSLSMTRQTGGSTAANHGGRTVAIPRPSPAPPTTLTAHTVAARRRQGAGARAQCVPVFLYHDVGNLMVRGSECVHRPNTSPARVGISRLAPHHGSTRQMIQQYTQDLPATGVVSTPAVMRLPAHADVRGRRGVASSPAGRAGKQDRVGRTVAGMDGDGRGCTLTARLSHGTQD